MIRIYRRALRTAKEFGRLPDDTESSTCKSYDASETSRHLVNARSSSSRSTKKVA